MESDAHKDKKLRQQEAFENRKAQATREKGLIIVNTGAGKGKTTAALGLAFRALGHGLKVGIVQFIKGAIPTGEAALAGRLELPVEMHTLGDGFTWNTQDREKDVASARRGWDKAVALLRDESYDVVILDELNVVLNYGYLPLDEVLGELARKRPALHVVITGRNAKAELIEVADLVTEMKLVKHPYREQGVKPQQGIEFYAEEFVMKPAILFVGHGSRDAEGTEEFEGLVRRFRASEPERIIEWGFLEFAQPVIGAAVARCVERGARTVAVLPGMLMAAGHAKNDIPSEIHEARRRYPGIDFHYGRHLHLHAKIIELCRLRLEEAEAAARPFDRRDTLLLVVGRGSSDPDANADVQKLARLLWEGMGYGWGAACYIGVTTPLLPEALERCERLGFGRVMVFPFFLFTGVLEKRIRQQTVEFASQHPGTEFLCAGYLNVHPLLFDVFRERAEEAVHGSPNMNCELCKYRVHLPGFEGAVGQPQVGHHHHVRGVGQDVAHGHHHHGH